MNKNQSRHFLYSDAYLILLLITSFVFWHLKIDIVGMSILAVVFMGVLCLFDDGTPAIPPVLFYLLTISKDIGAEFIENNFVLLLLHVLGALGSLIVYLARCKQKAFWGKQTIGMLLMAVAMLLGGINYDPSLTLKSIPSVLTIYICMLGGYLLFGNLIKRVDPVYFAKIMTYIGVLLVMQTASAYLTSQYDIYTMIKKKLLHVGWGLSNSIGALLLFTVPCTLYLITQTKRCIGYIIVFILEIFVLALTLSRGAIIMAVLGFPLLVALTCEKAPSRRLFISVLIYTLILFVVGIVVFWDNISFVISKIFRTYTGDRVEIYEDAINDFIKNPIMGISMYGRESTIDTNMFLVCWYHSTPLQFMANAGLVGLSCYIVHLVFKYRMLLKRSTLLNKYLLVAIIMWSGYGLIDVLYFSQNQLIFFALMLVFAEKNVYNINKYGKIFRKNNNLKNTTK